MMWRPVVGWEGVYEVSCAGEVRRILAARGARIGQLIQPKVHHSGYVQIGLNRPAKTLWLHRIVLEAFVGLAPKGYECDHIDFDKSNNALDNLRWLPRAVNAGRQPGGYDPQRYSKITWDIVREIRASALPNTVMARKYNITPGNIWLIKTGRTWVENHD